MILKCLIVDDSEIDRMLISNLVEKHHSLKLVAVCDGVRSAKKELKTKTIDLMFLDVEMPGFSGFDLLDTLKEMPQVIFIAGKKEHAFDAFRYNTTDYLQKPVAVARFDKAVKKALERHYLTKKYLENIKNPGYIFVKTNFKKHKLFYQEIRWFEGRGDYVKIITDDGHCVVLSTLKSFEEKLPKDSFMRIHKSYVVNLNKIDNYTARKVEIGKHQLPIGRTKRAALVAVMRERLPHVPGTEDTKS